MNFYKKLFQKTKLMREGVKLIQESFPVGARQIGRKIKYHLAGGAYGKRRETRWQTPEGKKLLEETKAKKFWQL